MFDAARYVVATSWSTSPSTLRDTRQSCKRIFLEGERLDYPHLERSNLPGLLG